MMDTILNLGLNDTTVAALATQSGNPRFAWDCYRRFVAMYGEVVMGVVAAERARRAAVRRDPRRAQAQAPRESRSGPQRGRAARGGRSVQGRGQAAHRRRRSPTTFAPSCGARSARCSGRGTTRARTYYRKLNDIPASAGHRRQRAGDGVRQPRRRLRDRRRVHAQPGDRHRRALRRVPDQRAGRGRRRRHPHARADRRAREDAARRARRARAASRSSSRITSATCRTSSSRSRRGSCSCCRPAPASAPARRWSRSRSTWSPRAS